MVISENNNTLDVESIELMSSMERIFFEVSKVKKHISERYNLGIEIPDIEMAECTICLEDFRSDNQFLHLPCSHVFHENCIESWVEENQYCPLCRGEIEVELSYIK